MIGHGRAFAILFWIATLTALLGAATAHGATLRSGQTLERDCAASLLADGAPGVAKAQWGAPAGGFFTAELRGGSAPDWDLAVFNNGRAIASSSSFTSAEKATAFVERGDDLVIQACRNAGSREEIELRTDLFEMQLPGRSSETATMESVTLESTDDVTRLERLGFDVTHDVSAGAATVALYSDAERAELADRGFESTILIPDLAAADAADRAAEAAAVAAPGRSSLPSARESYRQYNDYTTELKALATANPTLVRSVEIGRTFEDRPIEGVEIAVDVQRTDDGRPVYLNFGAHHAREWPSAELPMEFALDLVQRFNAGDARVIALLQRVRVIIVPVVNVDGFLVSRAGGTSPADDDSDATLLLSLAGQTPYNRKNCRPTAPADLRPCMDRSGEGVDLNRNYGAYWGGPGSGTNPATQNYRGTGPFSEPESDAVRDFTAKLHPTVFITNHTFTADGKWLRQPGFDAQFLPQDMIGALSPDETAMKSLGDAMQAANGWVSERGYETLGDITGATEDWNYFAQGTYGYTPEARGRNFHANYAESVVAEYIGTGESYLIAGERAAAAADHSVIEGTVPPGATLMLRKEFQTATCDGSTCPTGNGPTFPDVLETRLTGPADGTYEWDVNPSGRPLAPGESYTMSCTAPGGPTVSRQVAVSRGGRVTVDWAAACAPPVAPPGAQPPGAQPPGAQPPGAQPPGVPTPPGGGLPQLRCAGELATIIGTTGVDRIVGTAADDVIVARGGDDVIRGGAGKDRVCARGGDDTVRGGGGNDRLRGGSGDDRISGGGGNDQISGGSGRDTCRGGGGKNRLRSCN